MKAVKLFLILFILFGCINLKAQITWVAQNNPGVGPVVDIKALSNDTVFAMTKNQILKTVNGGTNWAVNHVHHIDSVFNVWSWVTHSLCYAGIQWFGGYFRTTNSGNSWQYFQVGDVRLVNLQFFINQNQDTVGFRASRYAPYLSITTTGGRTWNTFAVPGMADIGNFYFFNDQTGWVSGGPGGITKTTDRGFTWTNQGSSGFQNMFFLSENIGYAQSAVEVYKTTNGGTNWTMVFPAGNYNAGMFFHDVNSGWVGKWADNGLFKTTNGGNNWVQQNLGYSGINLTGISFIGYNSGWCSGHYSDNTSAILRTTNGSGVNPPVAPTLISPPNYSTGQSITPLLDWDSLTTATSYRVQLSTDSLFNTTIIDSQNVTRAQYQVAPGLLSNNVKYYWHVNATNIGGTGPYSAFWNFRTGFVGINQTGNEIPKEFKLFNNYPNPFNPSTKIRFDIPLNVKSQTSNLKAGVKLIVYDLIGKEISVLVNGQLNAGSYEVTFDASNFGSGIYFYRLEADGFIEVKKMVLVK